MKAAFVFALLACSVAMIVADDCVYSDTDGQPSCTSANVATKYFRNNWDPTHYWVCESVGATAVSMLCDGQWFNPTTKQCEDWSNWSWIAPCDPPTA